MTVEEKLDKIIALFERNAILRICLIPFGLLITPFIIIMAIFEARNMRKNYEKEISELRKQNG